MQLHILTFILHCSSGDTTHTPRWRDTELVFDFKKKGRNSMVKWLTDPQSVQELEIGKERNCESVGARQSLLVQVQLDYILWLHCRRRKTLELETALDSQKSRRMYVSRKSLRSCLLPSPMFSQLPHVLRSPESLNLLPFWSRLKIALLELFKLTTLITLIILYLLCE